MTTPHKYIPLFLRIALGTSLLSAVADRFGFWGSNANWGNWQNFVAYTHTLTFYLPDTLTQTAAVTATLLEIAFGTLLIAGYKTRFTATGTGFLLLGFAISMAFSVGIKATLDYSVWVGSAAAFLLSTANNNFFSIDNLFKNQHYEHKS